MIFAQVKEHVQHATDEDLGSFLYVWCPGCDLLHTPCVRRAAGRSNPLWQWNNDAEHPTIEPSILVTGTIRCHSRLIGGVWKFLSDCEHDLVGQEVPMVPLPEWVTAPVEEESDDEDT